MMNNIYVKAHERVDDLQRNGLRIIQDPGAFRFGMDAVLLADFTRVRPRERIADMGTGTGILALLLSQKQLDCRIDAFEIQPSMADMAQRSVCLNGLEERITVHAQDLCRAYEIVGREKLDVVVCNPPYGKRGGTLVSETKGVSLARHEADCTIDDIVKACASVLKNHGRLYMVFPAQRMLELCDAMRKHRMEPKQIRVVYPHADDPPYLVMIEAMKNAKPSLLWHPPLIVYHSDGSETDELQRIYHRF